MKNPATMAGFCLQVLVLATVEAGTGFVDTFEIAVADDFGIGIVDLQRAE